MRVVNAEAIRLIERLPVGSDWLDVAYRIYFRAKIEQGLADIEAGKGLPHDQVMREMEEWLASLGRPQPATTSSDG